MKECVAMLLAGGQGSRLQALTRTLAKPAVPFGGKYRIIDFPLSNCVNSGIDTVGILTQYQPLVLNDYIGNGQPWDLDRLYGGVHILPPYQKATKSDWYKGTANAIYQNINFIERYKPGYVLILSGDHVYRMDYDKMLAHHKKTKAECTIAVLEVPKEETSRFGIMTTDDKGRVVQFEEKPKNASSNLASMGVYIFTWSKLREYLERDEANEDSSHDFGGDIIPNLLSDKRKVYAYPFEGYWKDVGTIGSLWEANMDLLDPKQRLDIWDQNWKIYSRTNAVPPHCVSEQAYVENSIVTEGCYVEGVLDAAVLFSGVTVGEGAVVRDSILMPGAVVMPGAQVNYAIVAENAVVGKDAVVGARPEHMENMELWGIAVVAEGVEIAPGAVVAPKTVVEADVKRGRKA